MTQKDIIMIETLSFLNMKGLIIHRFDSGRNSFMSAVSNLSAYAQRHLGGDVIIGLEDAVLIDDPVWSGPDPEGNLQMFPRPTADPAAARTNPNFPEKPLLFSLFINSCSSC